MTDIARVPTLEDIYASKDAMDDIQSFTYESVDTFVDANGITRDTVTGRIKKMGYATPIAYAGAIVFAVDDTVKTVEEAGVVYAPFPSALPFTTSGTFIGDDDARFFVVQITNALVSAIEPYDNLPSLVADVANLLIDDVVQLGERTLGEGGGAIWDVVDATTVTENTFNIVAGDATRSFVLRKEKWVKVAQWGNTTAAWQAAIDSGSVIELPDTSESSYVHTAALTIDSSKIIFGQGENTIIENTTNDVEVFLIGNTVRTDRTIIKDLHITHEALTKYAINFVDAPYSGIENVFIECNSLGYCGVLWGDELTTPTHGAWLGHMHNCRVRNYKIYGVRVNSTGHTWNFTGNWVGSTVAGATGGYFNKEMVHINGGQWGANNIGGIPIHFYNTSGGDIRGGSVADVQFENIAAGEYGVVIDGDTKAFAEVDVRDIGGNFNLLVVGTLVKFDRAKWCRFISPNIDNVLSGGTVVEWGANSKDCFVELDSDTATAPVTVNPSAIRALKRVKGRILTSVVTNITTDSNLITTLIDGNDSLPSGFVPVHNGVAWNFQVLTLLDEVATSFTPPSEQFRLRIMRGEAGKTAHWFDGIVDVGTDTITNIFIGASFEILTGALVTPPVGGTGNFSGMSSSGGLIYIQAKNGTSRFTVLIEPVMHL